MDNRITDIDAAIARLAADMVYPEGHDPLKVTSPERPRKLALVLSGGGASGAFEAGVIEETARALVRHNAAHPDNPLHFDVVIGTSTGALNTWGWLLHTLAAQGALTPPAWLASRPGTTLNYKLWSHLAAHRSPSRFVLDKSWLLRLMQGAGRVTRLLRWAVLLLLVPLLLLGAFVLPWALGIDDAVYRLPAWAGWLCTAGGLGLAAGLVALLAVKKGLVQRSGRPVMSAALILLPACFLLGALKECLQILIAHHPWNSVAGYGIALLLLPVLLFLTLWSMCGDALFGNSRLKRLLARIATSGSSGRGLRRPVSRNRAEAEDRTVSRALQALWDSHGRDTTCIFTATNISAERQGLFLLGSEADCAALAAGHWLPILCGGNPPQDTPPLPGGRIPAEQLLAGVAASTAIPSTYPPEILDYEYAGPRRHVFVDGGVLDFAAYHAAIDLDCTHILAVETDCMNHDLMATRHGSGWIDLFSNTAATTYTGSDAEAREEAARVADTNRKVVHEGLTKKNLVLFLRIAPEKDERMISGSEFNGRFVRGRRVHALGDWIAYGQRVNPQAGNLPASIWYKDPNGEWRQNTAVRGPVIWDGSFQPSPGS